MNDEIITRILSHLGTEKKPIPFAPAIEAIVLQAEASLGFAIPELLKLIYLKIGNGGFGPGYGIIGVASGYRSVLGTLAESYKDVKKGAEYGGVVWPAGLLPFCEWGCNIFSCVDCMGSANTIYRSDACVARALKYDLTDFFNMWLNGVNILDIERPPRRSVVGINPFTRKPHTYRQ